MSQTAQTLNGVNTESNRAAIRAILYSGVLRTQLEPELMATNYVDVITDFPDGESWQDVEMGSMTSRDYKEGETIIFDGLDIGTRLFTINKYKQVGAYVTEKFTQDSYLSAQIMAQIPSLSSRAIYVELEQNILEMHSKVQTVGNANLAYNMSHRYVAGYDADATYKKYGMLQPLDFAYAAASLTRAGYTGPMIAIVPAYQAYEIAANPRLNQSLVYNPKWEGIVREGTISGMSFRFNIMGFDVYVSNYTDVVASETLKDREGKEEVLCTDTGVAQLFINQPERRPFRMAWRMMPKFEGIWNPYQRREEYITVCRYGVGVGDRANLVTILCNKDGNATYTVA